MKDMTLGEMLRRKMTDYGYSSVRELAEALGVTDSHIYYALKNQHGAGLELRRAMVQELDVSPEILERVARQ